MHEGILQVAGVCRGRAPGAVAWSQAGPSRGTDDPRNSHTLKSVRTFTDLSFNVGPSLSSTLEVNASNRGCSNAQTSKPGFKLSSSFRFYSESPSPDQSDCATPLGAGLNPAVSDPHAQEVRLQEKCFCPFYA